MSAPDSSPGVWTVPEHWHESGWQGNFVDRFMYYGTGGLIDPKNYTVEPWAISGGGSAAFWRWDRHRWAAFGKGVLLSQSIAFVGMGVVGAIWDPLDYTDGGLDEHIGSLPEWRDASQSGIDSFLELMSNRWPDVLR